MRSIVRSVLLVFAALAASLAQAAYNCNVSSGGFSAAYSPSAPTANIMPPEPRIERHSARR